ncbi:hypothetical protein [Paenibacillus sp. SYP-B4298]|uniref:hypothetical protein n=1 Tax=Paenibacillus sp. SYP-B4298 TaxID=2996034 RepID=UPI0022DDAC9E|nr:hypothetical protein [Paenibacillus sp. SYP-B4298]
MMNALYTFLIIVVVGAIFYGILWWENAIGLRFTKWFAVLTLIVALVGAVMAYSAGPSELTWISN